MQFCFSTLKSFHDILNQHGANKLWHPMMRLDSAHKAVIGSRFEPTSFDVYEWSHNTTWVIWIVKQSGDTIWSAECKVRSQSDLRSVWEAVAPTRGGAGNRWRPLQHKLGALTPLPSFCFHLFPLTYFFFPSSLTDNPFFHRRLASDSADFHALVPLG